MGAYKNKIIKRCLFGLVIILLLIPMVQQTLKFASEGAVDGYYTSTEKPKLSMNNWFESEYQKKEGQYLNEQFGFRPFFIRFYNQQYFTLYNQARANNVIIGKEQYLFGKDYIKAYLGQDFMGDSVIKSKADKLRMIKDTLAKKDIDLVVLFAPGKASHNPEYLPNNYKKEKDAKTNYEIMKSFILKNNILTLDFYDWFLKMKDTSSFPLFPKTGIHWSKYGEVLVADSLLLYISKLKKRPMPRINIFGFDSTSHVRDTDDDIEKGMNIFTRIPDLTMGYFHTQIVKDSTIEYPRVSVVADSYYWGLHNLGLSEKGFNKGDFWYYMSEVHHTNSEPMTSIHDVKDIIAELEKNEVIILLSTDSNLGTFFHGFTDRLYELYFPKPTS